MHIILKFEQIVNFEIGIHFGVSRLDGTSLTFLFFYSYEKAFFRINPVVFWSNMSTVS